MKKTSLLLLSLFICKGQLSAASSLKSCFLVKENNKILKQEGDCKTTYPPMCSFNWVLSLAGFDSGIFKSSQHPVWSHPKNIAPYNNVCKGDHNPHSWMRDSCLWYSQILTSKLGIKKLQDYVIKFSYGNMDLSGGLNHAWVSSSLRISPEDQAKFLQKMIDRKFLLSHESYENTKKIMFVTEMAAGWKLYGKTGSGSQLDENGNKLDLSHGWFIGYLEKGKRRVVFVNHIVDEAKQDTFVSLRAKSDTFIKLWYIINYELEK